MNVKDVLVFIPIVFLAKLSAATDQHCHNETGRCYWLGTGSKTWEAARTACQSDGGDLAVIETEELYNFVSNLFKASSPRLGASDTAQESDFRWLNGDPLRYEKFRSGEPNGRDTRNCIQMLTDGKWNDGACSAQFPYLCSSIAPACSVVKDDCTEFRPAFRGRYTGPFGPWNWAAAKSFCEARGQRIMTIDSQEEENYVENTLNPTKWLYPGITDAALETVFRTSEGFTTPWANWHLSSPNDAMLNAVEDCVRRQSSSGKWDDFRCTNAEKYYCEAPLIYINGLEEESETLIDNDADTCVNLTGSEGCTLNRISVRSSWANREITMEIRTSNVPCSDLSVVWRMTWEESNHGNYMKCSSVTMDTIAGNKYTCRSTCDVTTTGTTELKITTEMMASRNPAICDIKVL